VQSTATPELVITGNPNHILHFDDLQFYLMSMVKLCNASGGYRKEDGLVFVLRCVTMNT